MSLPYPFVSVRAIDVYVLRLETCDLHLPRAVRFVDVLPSAILSWALSNSASAPVPGQAEEVG